LDATIVFLEQRGNRINLLVLFIKHQQLARQVGDSRALSIVEQEAMAPRTVGELTGGMAHGGPNIHHGDLGPVARSGHTLGTASGSGILEFTYIGG
jgi:hypothetical protein